MLGKYFAQNSVTGGFSVGIGTVMDKRICLSCSVTFVFFTSILPPLTHHKMRCVRFFFFFFSPRALLYPKNHKVLSPTGVSTQFQAHLNISFCSWSLGLVRKKIHWISPGATVSLTRHGYDQTWNMTPGWVCMNADVWLHVCDRVPIQLWLQIMLCPPLYFISLFNNLQRQGVWLDGMRK